MMNFTKAIFLVLAAGLVSVFASGCVEEEPSMLLQAGILLSGSSEDLDSGGTALICSYPSDLNSAGLYAFSGQVNLGLLEDVGQDFGISSPASGISGTYNVVLGFENRLMDSRNVGAKGGGGGQGGFQGLQHDANYIKVSGVEVSFPPELNTFNVGGRDVSLNGYAHTRLINSMLTSDGGFAFMGVPVIANATERNALRTFVGTELGNTTDAVSLVAEIKVLGTTLAGTEVESNSVQYPIEVCVNCTTHGVTPTCVEN